MIKTESFKTKLFFEIAGFIYYIYEFYVFFHYFPMADFINGHIEVIFLRTILLFFIFPILYIFRISRLFGLGDAFSWFLASANAEEGQPIVSAGEEATGLGISAIINFLLGALIMLRIAGYFL
jgi:hypothetical protein